MNHDSIIDRVRKYNEFILVRNVLWFLPAKPWIWGFDFVRRAYSRDRGATRLDVARVPPTLRAELPSTSWLFCRTRWGSQCTEERYWGRLNTEFDWKYARSRLYQRRFLRPNTHFAAFFEIYKMRTFCTARNSENLQNFINICELLLFFRNFCKILLNFIKFRQNFCKICRNFAKI